MANNNYVDFDLMAKELTINPEEIIMLHKVYIDEVEQNLSEIENNILNRENWETTERLVHSIKGASGTLRIFDMYEIAKTFDDMLRRNIYDDATEMATNLRNLFEKQKVRILESIKAKE